MDVGVVERGVHLVQHAEGARPEVKDREQQRQAREGTLSAGKERHRLEPLAARLGHELDAGVERVATFLGFDQSELGAAALEQSLEEAAEVAVDLVEGLREPVLSRSRHAAERLVQVLDRRGEVVVLGAQEGQAFVELAVLVVGDQIHRTDGDEAFLDLGDPLPRRAEVARRIVAREQRGGVDPVHSPHLLPEHVAPHATLGRTDVDLVGGRDDAFFNVFHGPDLTGEPFVELVRASCLGVDAVALGRDVTGPHVGALPLVDQPRRALRELGLALLGLGEAPDQIALDLVEPREFPAQGLDALGRRREVDAARGELGGAHGLAGLRGLDRLAHAGDGGVEHALRVARHRDALREPRQRRPGLFGFAGDLPRLELDRLHVTAHPVVLLHRPLEVLLAGEPVGQTRLHRLPEPGNALAEAR